jgi:hypothetical protein
MLTPSSPVAPPFSTAPTNTTRSAAVEANARAAVQAQRQAGTANEARVADIADARATTQRAATAIPDPMASLSTVAVAGAMHSLPAALGMLQRIALASASGTLSDADQQNLQAEHTRLTAKVVSSVGSVGAGEQAQTSTAHDNAHDEDHGTDAHRDDGGGRRPVLAQATKERRVAAHDPVPAAPAPSNETPAGTLHDAAAGGESHAAHPSAAHAAQVNQFVQVTQPAHIAPLVGVA